MSEYFNQFFFSQDPLYSLIIEDNGSVCYIYLLKNKEIIGDVWLYNQFDDPDTTNWKSPDDMPFLNPKAFANPRKPYFPITLSTEILINWLKTDNILDRVEVFIENEIVAILKPQLKPGWSISARKDGPLAKSLIGNSK